MIVMIDNYDSFVYNLYQLIGAYHDDIKVIRNDELTVDEIRELKPEALVISPGPGRPEDAGNIEEVISSLYKEIPILGVCLGHQAICESFGGKITYANTLMHGKSSIIDVDTSINLFKDVSPKTRGARYHSLVGDEESLAPCLKVVARDSDGEIMAVAHREYPVYGLQFHPESILTDEGHTIIRNFLEVIYNDKRSN